MKLFVKPHHMTSCLKPNTHRTATRPEQSEMIAKTLCSKPHHSRFRHSCPGSRSRHRTGSSPGCTGCPPDTGTRQRGRGRSDRTSLQPQTGSQQHVGRTCLSGQEPQHQLGHCQKPELQPELHCFCFQFPSVLQIRVS